MSNLSSGPQSHHKSKQNSHHPHSSSSLSNQNLNKQSPNAHGSNGNGGPGLKKNVRAWGNLNSNNNPSGGTGGAWRNSTPGGNNMSPHFANGAVPSQTPSGLGPHFNQQHHPHPAAPHDDKLVMKAMHDRMLWFIMSLVGVTVTATTKSGQRFQGLLSSAVTEAELCITLKRAVELPVASTSTLPNSGAAQNRPPPIVKSTLIILAKELVEVVANDIDLSQVSSIGAGSTNVGNGFKTDAETLGYRVDANGQPVVREKELQTWVPSTADVPQGSPSDPAMSGLTEQEVINGLEDTLFPKSADAGQAVNRRTFDKPWDQFEANEKLFGTRTDFDEEIYTTKLDRTGKDFKEREKKAEMIAREIMASSSSNIHVQEERGLLVADDSGMNEEDKYGAVIRSEGAYVPPGARKGAAANRGSLQSLTSASSNKGGSGLQAQSSGTNMARHLKNINESEANSASMKVSASMPGPGQRPPVRPANLAAPSSDASSTILSDPAKDISAPQASLSSQSPSPAPTQPVPLVPRKAAPSVHFSAPTADVNAAVIAASAQKAAVVQQSELIKPPDEVTPRFKAFVSDEKERLQQKKKDLLKKEKESRLADLRAFSLSFKLPMALPKDLEPIIKKPTHLESPDAANLQAITETKQQLQPPDDPGRRASTTAAIAQDKNHVRYLSKAYNPSNLQVVANINSQVSRVATNPVARPAAFNPSVAIGLQKLGPLAVIPPYKPNNQKSMTTASANSVNASRLDGSSAGQSKVSSRFTNIPLIPPFKPKNTQHEPNVSMVVKDLRMNSKTAAFNPAAKTFNPVPGPKNAATITNRKSGQVADSAVASPPNPFFGNKPIKKGSSSMHVKEEFTPFKNSNVPEASSVGPAWNFTGKSYRQLFGASLPPHHHAHFMPHIMHHPMSHPQQQHAHHHVHQHPQSHSGGHGHPPAHHSQNMMNNIMAPPMHMQHSQQPHQAHHPHHPHNMVPQMVADDDGMSGGMSSGGGHMVGTGNGVVVNGPGMLVTAAGGLPVPSGHGYMPNNGSGMGQQQQPHPHHLPPPISPYMYHPQQQQPPPQPSPQSPYSGSYRHGHNGPGPSGGAAGYGPPVPVGVNMGGPVPGGAYGGPPVGPGPGNPGGPYMGQMNGYGGSPILGPGPVNLNGGNGHGSAGNGGGSNGSGGQPHVYSPQMGGLPGHGPPGMFPPPQMFHQQGGNGGGPPVPMANLSSGGGGHGPSPSSGGPLNNNNVGGGGGGRGNSGGGANGGSHPGQMYNYPVLT